MGCIQSSEEDGKRPSPRKSLKSRASRISVAIKIGSGIRKSRVHSTSKKLVCIFGNDLFTTAHHTYDACSHYVTYIIIYVAQTCALTMIDVTSEILLFVQSQV